MNGCNLTANERGSRYKRDWLPVPVLSSIRSMMLVGQYDSPYVRRVAVSLRVLGFDYQHDTRSVFADFDAMR